MPSFTSGPVLEKSVLEPSNNQSSQECFSGPCTRCSGCDTNYSDDPTVVEETPIQHYQQAAWPHGVTNDPKRHADQSPSHDTFSKDIQTRQRALDYLLQRSHRKAEAEYLRTSDASVFDHFLAPFAAKQRSSKREWVLDQSTQRWYLYDPDTEEVTWCPTVDSFA